jgi:Tfp pilus assembly protein PilF
MATRLLPAAAALALACGAEPAPPPAAAPAAAAAQPARYVGSAACAECHAQEAERWRGSHHELAMQEASPASVLGDFGGAEFTHFGVTSRFFREGEAFRVRTEGPDGALADFEVAYTFGVEPLQQYLLRLPGGRLQALSVAWDARPARQGGQRWYSLYPEERIAAGDPLHWTGREQSWNHMCAECHSTQVRKGYVEAEDRYETTFEALNVGCEACHGAGSAHVEWARQTPRAEAATGDMGLALDLSQARGEWVFDPGVPIARRTAPRGEAREVELCGRCHARRALLFEDHVPGHPLLDTHLPALLHAGLYHADGQIDGEVYEYGSFLQSRMYAAGVSCSDCHDPHALEPRGGPDAVCLGCHRAEVFDRSEHHHHAAGSQGARCVACHMPARTYMGIDERRDHGLRVPRPDLAESLGVPDACSGCHAERGAGWAAQALAGWRAGAAPRPHFAAALDAGRRRLPGAARALAGLAGDRAQPAIARATALELLGEQPSPPPAASVEAAAGDADPLLRLAAVHAAEALPPDARARLLGPLLRDPLRSVRAEAARALADAPPAALAPGDAAARARGLADYAEAQRLHADRPEAHLNLGLVAARQGELARAEAAYRRALALDPAFTPASVNLADLLRLAGRDAEGERVLREALARAPQSADLRHALGLGLVRLERPAEALAELGRAAELAPANPRYAYVYAVALHGAGQGGRARAVLEESALLHPGEPDLLLALALFARDAGDLAAARRFARELEALLPGDPQAAALRAGLEAR